MTKKKETAITRFSGNQGMHSPRNWLKCKKMITENTFSNARLHHLVLTKEKDASIAPSEADYLYAINAIAEKLRDNKVPCEWKAAFEVDDEKGLHLHVMLLVDAGAGGNPSWWLRYDKDGDNWLPTMLKAKKINFHLAPPKNVMHRTGLGKKKKYIYIPKKGGPELEDALVWCSYLYKNRSKEGVQGNIYHSSRPQRKKPTIESKNEAITEKTANSSPENRPPNEVMDFPVHSLEHEANSTTSASSEAKAKASDECHGASRVETSHGALSREIGQIGWSSADRSKMRRFCPVQAPEIACKRIGNLGILKLSYQYNQRSYP